MKLESVISVLHSSQSIRIYRYGELVTKGLRNEILDDSYLHSKVLYVFSENVDSISIEVE